MSTTKKNPLDRAIEQVLAEAQRDDALQRGQKATAHLLTLAIQIVDDTRGTNVQLSINDVRDRLKTELELMGNFYETTYGTPASDDQLLRWDQTQKRLAEVILNEFSPENTRHIAEATKKGLFSGE